MKLRKIGLLLLLIISAISIAKAQEYEYLTVVKLKDGSVLEGQMTEYREGEFIKMNIGQNDITIKFESIKHIKHKSLSSGNPYSFKEDGFYHHSSVAFLPGYVSVDNEVMGVGIDHTSGYLFNRWFGAGLNLGINNYLPANRELFYTVAAEARGYLMKKNLSPYYVVRTGYGFAHKSARMIEAKGGYFLNPSIGLRFTAKRSFNLSTEIGVNFQNGYFKWQNDGWWDRSIFEKDVWYRRFNLKFGILF